MNEEHLLTRKLWEAREEFEKWYLREQLKRHPTITAVAKHSGMERTAMQRKLRMLGIARPRKIKLPEIVT